ncbi:PREDICTED: zinc finger BED domain-containing protein RICESLEEPER 2-like [Ipomoea nil]|uniref:zinc finger BED domain-containing protein RICESLEEPER 2-like n=1 Tax=Ipomoea nil TaxID=35883 RepID=UPI0009009E98|nr:PREDICTED: zinc finger BED domain-containing protein RICESLEEPER 2-like [Ipomoea nil]
MGVCEKKPKESVGDVSVMSEQGKLDRVIDQKICRDLIGQCTIEHDLPFKWVEYRSVQLLLQYLYPNFRFITRNIAASDVMQMYLRQKEKLKLVLKNIPGMLCLTCDVWTACTNAGYICLTVHYVDEKWRLNNKILSFCDMPPPHSGFELSKKVYNCLVYWGIDRKVFSITLDNASANDVMVRLLKQQLLLQNSLPCDVEFFHVRCCAHILNLIVQDGLKVASVALGKIRESVKYVKGSEARMIAFQECAQRVSVNITCGLSTDVPTCWNSTYVMLDSAIRYRRVFCSLELQDRNYKCCPSNEEWSRAEKMCAFLYPFYAITNLISGSSYPTSNLYFLQVWKIECLLVENLGSEDQVISDMAKNMKAKFDKFWDDYSVILAMGAILDPRLKVQFVEYCYKKLNPLTCQDKIEGIKKKLYLLYDEYKKKSGDFSSSRVSTPQLQDYSIYSTITTCGVRSGGLGSMGGSGKLDENLIVVS